MAAGFAIFPHALFDVASVVLPVLRDLPRGVQVALIEDPTFFYDATHRPCRMHRLRLAFHRASCALYHAALRSAVPHARYVPFQEADAYYRTGPATMYTFDLHDETLRAKLRGAGKTVVELPSPMFLLSSDASAATLRAANNRFAAFFAAAKRSVLGEESWLRAEPSHDAENRKAWPASLPQPAPYCAGDPATRSQHEGAVVRAAIEFAEDRSIFPAAHPGSARALSGLALTHAAAAARLSQFVRERLPVFGPYEDAFHPDPGAVQMAHSHLSYLLNCGLITPRQVLDAVLAAYVAEKSRKSPKSPKNSENPKNSIRQSVEAFVRQLLGWREYMRAIYAAESQGLRALFCISPGRGRAPRCQRPPRAWYAAATGIAALDAEIRKCLDHAYAHHTVRLMVFLNLLLLSEVGPAAIYTWFMEMVSLDAYEWVMASNLAAMGYMPVGPRAARYMRKPYYCSSHYLAKMSGNRYPRDAKWDALFYGFLKKHERELAGGARVYLRNLRHLRGPQLQ